MKQKGCDDIPSSIDNPLDVWMRMNKRMIEGDGLSLEFDQNTSTSCYLCIFGYHREFLSLNYSWEVFCGLGLMSTLIHVCSYLCVHCLCVRNL